jgi:hypothetical protein
MLPGIARPEPTHCISPSPAAAIWQDVLAQAMTGELIAALNYTSLSQICDHPDECRRFGACSG